jgi:hypothetical protein
MYALTELIGDMLCSGGGGAVVQHNSGAVTVRGVDHGSPDAPGAAGDQHSAPGQGTGAGT